MIVYKDTQLRNHIEKTLDCNYKERYIIKDLNEYINSKNDRKVCCLYGLRRTGKTIMMLQAINHLNLYDKCMLIECEEHDTMWQVKKVLEENSDCKYVFIDEVTKADEFINTCSFLANRYAAEGIKIILAGTDSLGFFLAKNNELYDRAHLLHTTYISFKEYNHLLNKDIMSYIEYGGTLTDGEVFYNRDRLNEYTNTAIVYNIINSLEKWNRGINYTSRILRDIMEHGELPSFINKVIEMPDRLFVARIINKSFKSHDLGSLADLMLRSDIADADYIKTDNMNERVRIFLGIKEPHYNIADDKAVDTIIEYLKSLDVLYQIPKLDERDEDEYIFIQTGMRYCQANALAEALITSEEFDNYTAIQKHKILKKLNEDICGGILEDIVFYEIARNLDSKNSEWRNSVNNGRNKKNRIVTKYQDINSNEIDVLVIDLEEQKSVAIEVKLSDKQAEAQTRHLRNSEFCNEIEKNTGTDIVNKIVLYRGISSDGIENIRYINVEEFLKNSKEYIIDWFCINN